MSSIIQSLLAKSIVDQNILQTIKNDNTGTDHSMLGLLVLAGHLKEEALFHIASEIFPGPSIDLENYNFDKNILGLFPRSTAIKYSAIPLRIENDELLVALSDPTDILALDALHFLVNMPIKPQLCRYDQLTQALKTCYPENDNIHEILEATMTAEVIRPNFSSTADTNEFLDLSQMSDANSAFVQFVNKIIEDAIKARASDIHLEPQDKSVIVRYRVDGNLRTIIQVPGDLQQKLMARIKLLAQLDIAEQRMAQDGRLKILIQGRKMDIRISVIPVFYGEKIVLRILDTQSAQFDLNRIGLQPDELEKFKDAIHKPQGVILVTGPTGSGKTTTLYSALQHIKSDRKNIVTIEDPIEYLIDGINQLQLSRFKDVTFANGLRSILRQDPDVILVGEIRDKETAEIASRASLTGHLVFSTLHTNSAVSSITRLVDIGIEPHLIASSSTLLIAQRLIRMICLHCCEPETPNEKLLKKFSAHLDEAPTGRFYSGKGCQHCNNTGFYGRTSIFELLKIDDPIRELIYNRAPENVIMKEAIAGGMRPLAKAGILKAVTGLSTLEEISRVVDVMDGKTEMFFPN